MFNNIVERVDSVDVCAIPVFRVFICCVCFFEIITPFQAQTNVWRREDVGVFRTNSFRNIQGTLYTTTLDGMYRLDSSSRSWMYQGWGSWNGNLRFESVQPNGVLLATNGPKTLRFRVKDLAMEVTDSGRVYDVAADDTLTGFLETGRSSYPEPTLLLATWRNRLTNQVLQLDSLSDSVKGLRDLKISCTDSSVLWFPYASSNDTRVARFRFGSQPEFVVLPDTFIKVLDVDLHQYAVYFLLKGKNTLMYSFDNGQTWKTIPGKIDSTLTSHTLSVYTDRIYAVKGGSVLVSIDVGSGQTDTLVTNMLTNVSQVIPQMEHTNDGLLIANGRDIQFYSEKSGSIESLESGIPRSGITSLRTIENGVFAVAHDRVITRQFGAPWEFFIDFPPGLNQYQQPVTIVGGRSVNDVWMEAGSFAIRYKDRAYIDASEYQMRPRSGVWVHPQHHLMALLFDIGELSLFYWSDSSPLQKLISNPAFELFLPVSDSVFLVFTKDGKFYRNSNQPNGVWEEGQVTGVTINSNLVTTAAKGRHVIIQGSRFLLTSHDEGKTWRLDSLSRSGLERATVSRDGVLYIVHPHDSLKVAVVEQMTNGVRSQIATLNLDTVYVGSVPIDVQFHIAYNDSESRLYVGSNKWMYSMAVQPTSVNEQNSSFAEFPAKAYGYYDLLGRYVGENLQHVGFAAGPFLKVDELGSRIVFAY